jgi:hypothetical protein
MNIQQAYDDVKKFNSIAGNLSNVTPKSINSQLDFIHEELCEASAALGHEACDCGQEEATPDAVELLDGACDLFVTVAGLMQKLEAAGFNVQEALKRVNENNLSKFPECKGYCLYVDPSLCPEGAEQHLTQYGRVVFKREHDGKIMKPTNFVTVDIADCVPEDFFGVGEEY